MTYAELLLRPKAGLHAAIAVDGAFDEKRRLVGQTTTRQAPEESEQKGLRTGAVPNERRSVCRLDDVGQLRGEEVQIDRVVVGGKGKVGARIGERQAAVIEIKVLEDRADFGLEQRRLQVLHQDAVS